MRLLMVLAIVMGFVPAWSQSPLLPVERAFKLTVEEVKRSFADLAFKAEEIHGGMQQLETNSADASYRFYFDAGTKTCTLIEISSKTVEKSDQLTAYFNKTYTQQPDGSWTRKATDIGPQEEELQLITTVTRASMRSGGYQFTLRYKEIMLSH
ncbi:MAG: hypothetical protein MUF29_09535 [Chitinophagaceae bacterium]|nr:hypothetical protein [Chitinophagaceae bacterium]